MRSITAQNQNKLEQMEMEKSESNIKLHVYIKQYCISCITYDLQKYVVSSSVFLLLHFIFSSPNSVGDRSGLQVGSVLSHVL